ncbi:MAG: iron-containing alcohol dehydrogenase [Bradymonadia bacterium]
MQNFDFQNPTRILFGEGQIAQIAEAIPADARVLLLYGGGSIKRNGVYDQTVKALTGHTFLEFGGVEPNPTLETLSKAIDLVKAEALDFVLAVGGGSVADGAKFVAAGARFEGDPWAIIAEKAPVTAALDIGVILTLPATGSESNGGSVVTRKATQQKLFFNSPLVYPKFAVLDPTTTYSLPPRQTANGVVDAFVHTMEQYLTYPADAPLQDRFAEGILLTLIEEGPKVLTNPTDYTARANVMWSATMALNGLIGRGVPQDWTTHMIGHEITAAHGLDHAQTLAIVLPAVMTRRIEQKGAKLLQYARRVWGIDTADEDTARHEAIDRTRRFFESLGVPTRLSAYDIDASAIDALVGRLEAHGMVALSERGDITPAISREILALAV